MVALWFHYHYAMWMKNTRVCVNTTRYKSLKRKFRFAIADRQGRWIVAPRKGIDRLNAIILMDAPGDPDERLRFEAEYFIGQDSEV